VKIKSYRAWLFGALLLSLCACRERASKPHYDIQLLGSVGNEGSELAAVRVEKILYGDGLKEGSELRLSRHVGTTYHSLEAIHYLKDGDVYKLFLRRDPSGPWVVILAEPATPTAESTGSGRETLSPPPETPAPR
jgi:hypothetical protein